MSAPSLSALRRHPVFRLVCASLLVAFSGACASQPPLPPEVVRKPATTREMAAKEALAAFEAPEQELYRLGRGDRIAVEVWGRPELSGPHVVGPDGVITAPLLGPLKVEELTREAAAQEIGEAYSRYYTTPVVTVRVEEYTSNRVFILGRVGTSGALRFEGTITLLEALSRAASLPVSGTGSELAALNRCAVFRGRDKAVWVDLEALLTGRDANANIRLHRNDVIYLPDSEDQMVMVLGEVTKPGAYRITPGMRLLDALGKAGGPTKDAGGSLRFIRPNLRLDHSLKLQDVMVRRPEENLLLEEGDILYVPRSGLANVGYFLQQISAGLLVLLIGVFTGTGTTVVGTSSGTDTAQPRVPK